jgi:hypothetical protein
MRYEDTVMSEEGRCDCGVRVDEGDNYGQDGDWLCADCHAERVEADAEWDAPFADESLTLAPRTNWLAIAADITGAV